MHRFLISLVLFSFFIALQASNNSSTKEENPVYKPKGWYSSMNDTMAYHNETTDNIHNMNADGYRQPRSGNAYCGFTAHNAQTKNREYLTTKLNTTLQAGKEYTVTFYVTQAQSSTYWPDNLGAMLSTNVEKSDALKSKSPKIQTNDHAILSNGIQWKKITGNYTANGGEQYLTVGSFGKYNSKLDDSKEQNLTFAHYYIDNVSVMMAGGKNNLVDNGGFEEYIALSDDKGLKPMMAEPEPIVEEVVEREIVVLTEVKFEEAKVDQKIVLNNIIFETGKSALLKESYSELDHLIDILNEFPNMHIEITGHTDNLGAEEFNLKLSTERAKAVVDYLVSKNIPAERLDVEGHGSAQPVRSNATEEGRHLNRRVEFTIKKL